MKKQLIVQGENLSVSFTSGRKRDDYKSHIFNFIRKKKVQKSEKFWSLKNIDITGYEGEVLGIIGSNGSGKTTLCKLISGILQPDEGNITVNGKVSALFSLGLGFNKELSGRENVYLNGMMLGISNNKINEFMDDIEEFSGIGKFIDQPVKYYSSGMKARLGFSVAAHMEPEILIIDEALNTGDLEFSVKAALKMKELVQKSKMVILVTHSLKYAQQHCHRLIWIDKGEVQGIGEPAEIIEKYKATIPAKLGKRNKRYDLQKTKTKTSDVVVAEANNLSIHYQLKKQNHQALNNINFQIKEGEVIGIIGHNGAGKSTLCKVLTNILTPDEGTIKLKGKTTALLGFGSGFNEKLSGKDNVFLNGMLLGIPKKKIKEHYSEIVQFSELGKFIDEPVKQYSSGMKSRLGFSIAATIQPDIFIIDEALSAGDLAFRQKASQRIQEMIEQAKAVIVVTHSMSFVKHVCTRAIWLNNGEIRFDGNPEEATEIYKQHVKKKRSKA